MHPAVARRACALAVTAIAALALSSCAATLYDSAESIPPSTAAAPTTLPSGTVEELLPRLLAEASSLSTVLDQRGDVRAVGERIQQLWNVIRPQMDAADPQAVGPFEAALALSMRSVDKGRRADADKAAKNLQILIHDYLQR